MTITYRFYEGPEDLQSQINFWITATKKDSLERLGFTEQTEDVMMMKKSDPTE